MLVVPSDDHGTYCLRIVDQLFVTFQGLNPQVVLFVLVVKQSTSVRHGSRCSGKSSLSYSDSRLSFALAPLWLWRQGTEFHVDLSTLISSSATPHYSLSSNPLPHNTLLPYADLPEHPDPMLGDEVLIFRRLSPQLQR